MRDFFGVDIQMYEAILMYQRVRVCACAFVRTVICMSVCRYVSTSVCNLAAVLSE